MNTESKTLRIIATVLVTIIKMLWWFTVATVVVGGGILYLVLSMALNTRRMPSPMARGNRYYR